MQEANGRNKLTTRSMRRGKIATKGQARKYGKHYRFYRRGTTYIKSIKWY